MTTEEIEAKAEAHYAKMRTVLRPEAVVAADKMCKQLVVGNFIIGYVTCMADLRAKETEHLEKLRNAGPSDAEWYNESVKGYFKVVDGQLQTFCSDNKWHHSCMNINVASEEKSVKLRECPTS